MIFIYDGAFEGFLSAVFDAYSRKTEPLDIVSSLGEMQLILDADYHYVETTEEKADRLMAGMDTISDEFSDQVILAFLSWMPGKEMMIYRYIAMGFKIREKIFSKLDDDTVRKFLDMCRQTGREVQTWKGFLRFSIMDNHAFYAEMSPQNNVLTLIMPHFTRRMGPKPFLIHDTTYSQMGVYDTREWWVRPSEGLTLPRLHSDEMKYRYMWKLFYDTTAIEGRANSKQRQQMMPERYQKHVTELQQQSFQGDFNKSAAAVIQGTENSTLITIGEADRNL